MTKYDYLRRRIRALIKRLEQQHCTLRAYEAVMRQRGDCHGVRDANSDIEGIERQLQALREVLK